jgi:hypothetical protein
MRLHGGAAAVGLLLRSPAATLDHDLLWWGAGIGRELRRSHERLAGE